MSRKNKLILALLAVGIALFCTIEFYLLPTQQAEREAYARAQTDAMTHDIAAIEPYRFPYLGNASNIGGLFEHLPLNHIAKKYEIDANDCILTVHYLDTVWSIGEDKVRRDLLYNAVAAMAAIDNMAGIVYQFSGDSYAFDRAEIEQAFGSPLSALLAPDQWHKAVQNRLNDREFVGRFFQ